MELISREEVKTAVREYHKSIDINDELVFEMIDGVPAIESRPTGVWVGIDEEPHEEWECSNCGNIINTFLQDELEEHKYCHKCGAKMSTPWVDMGGEK